MTDVISIRGVNLSDPQTYVAGTQYDAFRNFASVSVAWHRYTDRPGFLTLSGYDEVSAVYRDSTAWSSELDPRHSAAPHV